MRLAKSKLGTFCKILLAKRKMTYIRSYKLNYISFFSRYDQLIWISQELAGNDFRPSEILVLTGNSPKIPIAGGSKKSEFLVFIEIPSIETDAFSSNKFEVPKCDGKMCNKLQGILHHIFNPRFFQWQEFLSNPYT